MYSIKGNGSGPKVAINLSANDVSEKQYLPNLKLMWIFLMFCFHWFIYGDWWMQTGFVSLSICIMFIWKVNSSSTNAWEVVGAK